MYFLSDLGVRMRKLYLLYMGGRYLCGSLCMDGCIYVYIMNLNIETNVSDCDYVNVLDIE